jgi:hypothetical protein
MSESVNFLLQPEKIWCDREIEGKKVKQQMKGNKNWETLL